MGKAKTSKNETIKAIQVNTGILMRVIPGARIFKIVMTKFNAAAKEETPNTKRPNVK